MRGNNNNNHKKKMAKENSPLWTYEKFVFVLFCFCFLFFVLVFVLLGGCCVMLLFERNVGRHMVVLFVACSCGCCVLWLLSHPCVWRMSL